MAIEISHIEYYLPDHVVTNDMLKTEHPDWDIEKVEQKSGVKQRHMAANAETALDLSIRACEKLFSRPGFDSANIGGIVYCTQSADYIMPSNAFLIQKHFNLSNRMLAFDYNLACSGFVYGMAMARGLIETGVTKNILLITADTYSKYIGRDDRSTRVLFGDAAAVTFLRLSGNPQSNVIDVSLESSGQNYDSFYIPAGGSRNPSSNASKIRATDISGNLRSPENIHMNGFAVWKFISQTVPVQINELLQRNKLLKEDIDLYVFHQASKLTLDSLVKVLKLPQEKVYSNIENIGNTVSASIPIALQDALTEGRLKKGDMVLLSGFGVGLSWGSMILRF